MGQVENEKLATTTQNKNGEFCAETRVLCIFRNLNFNRKDCAF